ncbi:MAG: EAL domain-containing protein [Acholeplasmatales bacterium]|nr:EAL domain-containing protein [Acholeplasmatales bacterium]
MTNFILVEFGSAQIYLTIAMCVFVAIGLIAFRINDRIQMRVALLMDNESRTFNRNGFAKYLKRKGKKFKNPSLINVRITNLGYLYTTYPNKDELMYNIADTMLKGLDKRETLGRVEFREFILLLEGKNKEDLRNKCKDISNRLSELYFENYGVYNFKIEFGVNEAVDLKDYQTAIDKTLNIINYSDIRQSNIWYYSQVVSDIIQKYKTINELKSQALETRQFAAYVQPKVDYHTGNVIGGEILCRWVDENHNVVFYPGDFIPLFEKNGFIKKLDFVMFEHTCSIAQTLKQKGYKIVLSVNISKINFDSPTFIDDITNIINKYPGCNPSDIEIEITESANMEGSQHLSSIIMNLRQLGYKLAMDDFGKDYSTLGSLVNCPYDTIKMDMFFFRNRLSTEKEKDIAVNVLNLLSRLNVEIVCEGIEDENTINILGHITHDFVIQGYYISKPIPISQFEPILKTHYDFVYPELVQTTEAPESLPEESNHNQAVAITESNKEIIDLRKQLDEMRKMLDDNKRAQEDERHNRELEDLRKEIQALKSNPNKDTSEVDRLKRELEDLRKAKELSSNDELANLQRQIDSLRNGQQVYQQPYPYPAYQQVPQQQIDVEGLIARLKEANRQQLEQFQAQNKKVQEDIQNQFEQARVEREELQRLLSERDDDEVVLDKDEIARKQDEANEALDLNLDDTDDVDDDLDDDFDDEEDSLDQKPTLSKDEIYSMIDQFKEKYGEDQWIDKAQEEMGVEAFAQLNRDLNYYKENEKKTARDKIVKGTPELKKLYNIVKNEFMKYSGVTYKMTNSYDQIYIKKKLIAKIGSTPSRIRVFLALDPSTNPNVPHKDVSSKKAHVKTPFYMKCKSSLSIKRLSKLVASIAKENGTEVNKNYKPFDYATSLKYETVK